MTGEELCRLSGIEKVEEIEVTDDLQKKDEWKIL